MTPNHVSPNHHPRIDHDARTVHRPQMTFVPQIGPVPRPADSSPTWKTGWVVSGVAAILALVSLTVMGAVALDALTQSDQTPEAVSTSAPVAPSGGGAAPAPVLPAPVVTVNPAAPGPAPTANAPQVVVIPGPAAAPAVQEDPVVTPADPVVAPPKPPLGIGTCDLVACDPKPAPPKPPIGIGTCDLVACPTQPSASRP